MFAAAAATSASANARHHDRRAWKPDGDAHLIFQWVKMEGKGQGWVASQLGINQSTVSRVVQRYERWQAHARLREGGRLDPSERLRAQRWLTFERNELILASCLRIAGEMEGFVDTSKSTIRRPLNKPSQESDIRTEHAVLDRSGIASRFLRLAFRINMEQLKLAELDQPPEAEPLTDEEIEQQEREAAADAEELARSRQRAARAYEAAQQEENEATEPVTSGSQAPAWELETSRLPPRERSGEGEPSQTCVTREDPGHEPSDEIRETDSALHAEPTTSHESAAESLHTLHKMHNADAQNIGASASEPCSCAPSHRADKFSQDGCIIDIDEHRNQSNGSRNGATRRRKRVKAK